MFYVLIMSLTGKFKRFEFEFNSSNSAWDFANNIPVLDKWEFPIQFIVSGSRVHDTCLPLLHLKNKQISFVSDLFKQVDSSLDPNDFIFAVPIQNPEIFNPIN